MLKCCDGSLKRKFADRDQQIRVIPKDHRLAETKWKLFSWVLVINGRFWPINAILASCLIGTLFLFASIIFSPMASNNIDNKAIPWSFLTQQASRLSVKHFFLISFWSTSDRQSCNLNLCLIESHLKLSTKKKERKTFYTLIYSIM